jgi:hypothetical protein
MIEVTGNLFTYNPKTFPLEKTPDSIEELLSFEPSYGNTLRCITTCGIVNKNGYLVMGAGIAKEAKRRFNELPYIFGERVDERGNHLHIVEKYGVASFPTKNDWKDPSDINLIAQSCRELFHFTKKWDYVLLPRVGCTNGGLLWKDVRPIIASYLHSDKFIVVHPYKV